MKTDDKGLNLTVGNRIRIIGLNLAVNTGTVIDANWWRDSGWYIEIE